MCLLHSFVTRGGQLSTKNKIKPKLSPWQITKDIDNPVSQSKLQIELFRERLSNKTVRDIAERYYG